MANKITGSITTDSIVIGRIGNSGKVKGGTDRAEIELIPGYEGPYEVTPNRQEQVLQTDGYKMTDDVTVHAIPSEYIIPAGTAIITQNGITNIRPYEYADVNVPIPPGYIIPEGSQTVTENGEYDVTSLAEMVVNVEEYVEPVLQSKTWDFMPIDTGSVTNVFTADEGYDGLEKVTVKIEAIPIEQKTVAPAAVAQVVTPSEGKYLTQVTVEAMPSQRLQAKEYIVDHVGTETITADSGYEGLSEVEITVWGAGKYDEGYTDTIFYINSSDQTYNWRTRYFADWGTGGFLDGVKYGDFLVRPAIRAGTTVTPTESVQTVGDTEYVLGGPITISAIPSTYIGSGITIIPAGTTVTPSESTQTIGGANCALAGPVTVSAIPSNYVGSGITRRDGEDLWGAYEDGAYHVNGPAGYYAYPFYLAVPPGTEGVPTATAEAVGDHIVKVTPSVTNSAGYITGSTKTGVPVHVRASDLTSGTKSINQNGSFDVVNYASVDVDVLTGTFGDDLEYGFTDTTLPMVGLATADYTMIFDNTSPLVGLGEVDYVGI